MKNSRSVQSGARVDARDEPWLVVNCDRFDDCSVITLRGAGDDNLGTTAWLLAPFDRIRLRSDATRVVRAHQHAAMRHAARAIARAHDWCGTWTAVTASIDLLPWQLEPARAAVAGSTRLLLADAVGLGKTIQAGLVTAELRARGLCTRALVLTPASLLEQWATELSDRFQLAPDIFNHASLTDLVRTLPVGVNPWSTGDVIVSSIDLVKRAEVRAALDAIAIDLLIVDEAHHLTPGTDRAAVVEELAARATWVVLVTATPHSGDSTEYAFLRRLGATDDGDEVTVFRRTRAEIGHPQDRRTRFRAVHPDADERGLLEHTESYARAIWQHHKSTREGALVASVICRRAVSSPAALIATLSRRRSLLAGVDRSPAEVQTALPWMDTDSADATEADTVLSGARLSDCDAELAAIDALLARADAIQTPAKYSILRRLLARVHEPVIVFSEYRDTLIDLEARLGGHVRTSLLHGGLSPRERHAAIQRFVTGHTAVLLATDAAGEGLNLQARCRLVINIELPWNPVRLEQRMGRVDRLGQTRRVHGVHLFHRGTFEDRVFARLHRRIAQAAADLSSWSFDDRTAAAAVLDDQRLPESQHVAELTSQPPTTHSSTLLRRRAWECSGRRDRPSPGTVLVSHRSERALVAAFTLLFEHEIYAHDGRLVARAVRPLVVQLARPFRVKRRMLAAIVRRLERSPFVQSVVEEFAHQHTTAIAANVTHSATRIARRLAAIDIRLSSQRPPMIQGSLFDKRAEQRARANSDAMATLTRHVRHRMAVVNALTTLRPSTPRLAAGWTSFE